MTVSGIHPFSPSWEVLEGWGRQGLFTEDCSPQAFGVSTLVSKIMRLAGNDAEKIAKHIRQIKKDYQTDHDVMAALSIMLRLIGMGEPLPDSVECWQLYQERVICHLTTSTAYLREFSHLLYPVDHELNLQACHVIIEIIGQPLGCLLNDSQRMQVKQVCEQLLERKKLFQHLLMVPEVHPSIVKDLQHDLGVSDKDQNIKALAMRALVLTLFEPIGQSPRESDCYAVAVARHLQVVDPSLLVKLISQGMETGVFVYNGVEVPISELTRARRATSVNALLNERLIIPRWIVALFEFLSLNDMQAESIKRRVIDNLLSYLDADIPDKFREDLIVSLYFFRSRLFGEQEGQSEQSIREISVSASIEANEVVHLSTICMFVDWIKKKMTLCGLDVSLFTLDKEFYISLNRELVEDELHDDAPFFLQLLEGDTLSVMGWQGLDRLEPAMHEYEFNSPVDLFSTLLQDANLLKRESVVVISGGHTYRLTPQSYAPYLLDLTDIRVSTVIKKHKKRKIRISDWRTLCERDEGIAVPEVLKEKMRLSEFAQMARSHLPKRCWERYMTEINDLFYLIFTEDYKKSLSSFLTDRGLKPLNAELVDQYLSEPMQSITSFAYLTQKMLMENNQGYISIDYFARELALYFDLPPTIYLGDLDWVVSTGSEIFESTLVLRWHLLHERWELYRQHGEEFTLLKPSFYRQFLIMDDYS